MMLRLAAYADYNNIAYIHSDSWIKNYSKDLNSSYLQRDCRRDRLEFWNHRLSSPKKNQRVIIAEHDNAIVGFACVHIDECSIWGAYLDNLHVVED